MDICVFCSEALESLDTDNVAKLGLKGSLNINKISETKSDGIKVNKGQFVHKLCRKNYTRPTVLKEIPENHSGQSEIVEINQSDENFLQNVCLFCSKTAKLSECRKRGLDVHKVEDPSFEITIRKCIQERNDQWAQEVLARIGSLNLVSIRATYHQKCSLKFRTSSESNTNIGRPQDQAKDEAFLKVCTYMTANEDEIFTVPELCDRMRRECDENTPPYSRNYMKQRLLVHFKDNIVMTQLSGTKTLVLFRNHLDHIIADCYEQRRNSDSKAEKRRIVQSAAKLILSDIKSINSSKDKYPHPGDFTIEAQTSYVPFLLTEHLTCIIKSKNRDLKIAAIGQAIVQAARPRSLMAPLQIGLGVQIHHHSGSKFLVENLNSMGFCSSYGAVQEFELCAALSTKNEDVQEDNQHNEKKVIKFVADNVDHDTRTLDGKNTFHGMGMIASFTPGNTKTKAVKRVKANIEDVRDIGTVPIIPYDESKIKKALFYEKINDSNTEDSFENTDFLLSITWGNRVRPSWNGIMQSINHGTHSGKSSITFLPMIDLNPSDLTCINSTLHFVANQAKKYGITPILALDQPLWWKAHLIIQNEPESSPIKNMVLLLGSFHTAMSFLGCIGSLMEEMGLAETLETIYAPNSVTHILSGKAFSRAVRGHFIVDNALNTLLAQEVVPQVLNEENDWSKILAEVNALSEDVINKNIEMEEINSNISLKSAKEKIERVKQLLSKDFRTARLWIQYMEMVQILRSHFRSERIGSYSLFLDTCRKMLPYFPAARHNHYAKCLYIFIQQMLQLKDTHPDVHEIFSRGDFVIRRSDRYWSAVGCDQTIEQTYMRGVKSQKGLTRCRGMNENQRLIWVNSMPDCIEMNNAMQQLTGLHFETSDQHKECGASRQKRDHEDTQRVFDFLKERNPFQREDSQLRNICNGMKAGGKVNLDDAARIGENIVSSMAGKDVAKFTFRKSNSVIKMNEKNALEIDGEMVTIDPQLLFQRLILITKGMNDDELQNVFTYELSQKPAALFDEWGLLREANNLNKELINLNLYDALWKKAGSSVDSIEFLQDCQFILNGHSLINAIPWQKNETFDAICSKYLDYVARYGRPTVVFYSNYDSTVTTKDEMHLRRSKGIPGKDILFTGSMVLNCKKESFLSNKSNMQRFINMLGNVLHENNFSIIYASVDPLTTIAQTAVDMATIKETVIVGGDISMLVTICHHFDNESHNIWFEADCLSKSVKLWNLGKIDEILGRNVMKNLIFLHVVMGSESTSHPFGLSAGTALKKFEQLEAFREVSEVFLYDQSKIPDIIEAGNKALCILYNGKGTQKLNDPRYQRFLQKVKSRKSAVTVQYLPPTEDAARYHSFRTYYQIQIWLGQTTLDPLEFGWESKGGILRAKTTDRQPAPAELLSSIRCQCKGDYSTKRCNCQKHYMKCSTACGECKGSSCDNSIKGSIHEDDDDDEDAE